MLSFLRLSRLAHRGMSLLGAVTLAALTFSSAGAAGLAEPSPSLPSLPDLPDVVPACPGPAPEGHARCHARIRRAGGPTPAGSLTYAGGYKPGDLQSAYALASAAQSYGSGRTVAIVDAFHNPTAAQDLANYRAFFGLSACTGPCFRQVDQSGGTNYPVVNTGWASEIALDIEMVSAICPACSILLVEANSNAFSDLGAAANYAATVPGVVAISNSYGGGEFALETSYEGPYNHPGIAVTVSSGDGGYGVEFPAASRYVTAVGGTSLTTASTARGWSERAWSGAGSGCSRYIGKPSWQKDAGCGRRTVADVAAVADPNTGVAVLDTTGSGGWTIFGGTSIASPIIASVYALAGNTSAVTYGSYPYTHTASLNDVISGSNGGCRRTTQYLCTSVSGYDGPTGNGTPNGIGGF